jgi:hypothetical protein
VREHLAKPAEHGLCTFGCSEQAWLPGGIRKLAWVPSVNGVGCSDHACLGEFGRRPHLRSWSSLGCPVLALFPFCPGSNNKKNAHHVPLFRMAAPPSCCLFDVVFGSGVDLLCFVCPIVLVACRRMAAGEKNMVVMIRLHTKCNP